jgi:hypothetical protein
MRTHIIYCDIRESSFLLETSNMLVRNAKSWVNAYFDLGGGLLVMLDWLVTVMLSRFGVMSPLMAGYKFVLVAVMF